jgi:hypothetical protein
MREVTSSLTSSGSDALKSMPAGALYTLSKEFEGMLAELVNLDLVTVNGDTYRLTDKGRPFFQRVSDKQQAFFTRIGNV